MRPNASAGASRPSRASGAPRVPFAPGAAGSSRAAGVRGGRADHDALLGAPESSSSPALPSDSLVPLPDRASAGFVAARVNAADVADRVRGDPGRDDHASRRAGTLRRCRDEWVVFTKDPESVRAAVEDASTPRCPHLVGRAPTRRPHVLVSERRGGATAASLGLGARPLGGVVRRFVRCAECWEKLETKRLAAAVACAECGEAVPLSKTRAFKVPRSLESTSRTSVADVCFLCAPRWASAVAIADADAARLAEARDEEALRAAARDRAVDEIRALPRRERLSRLDESGREREASAGGEKTRRSTAALADARRLFAEAAKEAGTAERLTREAISRRKPRDEKTERAGGAAAAYRPWELGYVAEAGESDAAEGGVLVGANRGVVREDFDGGDPSSAEGSSSSTARRRRPGETHALLPRASFPAHPLAARDAALKPLRLTDADLAADAEVAAMMREGRYGDMLEKASRKLGEKNTFESISEAAAPRTGPAESWAATADSETAATPAGKTAAETAAETAAFGALDPIRERELVGSEGSEGDAGAPNLAAAGAPKSLAAGSLSAFPRGSSLETYVSALRASGDCEESARRAAAEADGRSVAASFAAKATASAAAESLALARDRAATLEVIEREAGAYPLERGESASGGRRGVGDEAGRDLDGGESPAGASAGRAANNRRREGSRGKEGEDASDSFWKKNAGLLEDAPAESEEARAEREREAREKAAREAKEAAREARRAKLERWAADGLDLAAYGAFEGAAEDRRRFPSVPSASVSSDGTPPTGPSAAAGEDGAAPRRIARPPRDSAKEEPAADPEEPRRLPEVRERPNSSEAPAEGEEGREDFERPGPRSPAPPLPSPPPPSSNPPKNRWSAALALMQKPASEPAEDPAAARRRRRASRRKKRAAIGPPGFRSSDAADAVSAAAVGHFLPPHPDPKSNARERNRNEDPPATEEDADGAKVVDDAEGPNVVDAEGLKAVDAEGPKAVDAEGPKAVGLLGLGVSKVVGPGGVSARADSGSASNADASSGSGASTPRAPLIPLRAGLRAAAALPSTLPPADPEPGPGGFFPSAKASGGASVGLEGWSHDVAAGSTNHGGGDDDASVGGVAGFDSVSARREARVRDAHLRLRLRSLGLVPESIDDGDPGAAAASEEDVLEKHRPSDAACAAILSGGRAVVPLADDAPTLEARRATFAGLGLVRSRGGGGGGEGSMIRGGALETSAEESTRRFSPGSSPSRGVVVDPDGAIRAGRRERAIRIHEALRAKGRRAREAAEMGADAAGGGGVCRVDVATRGGGGGGGGGGASRPGVGADSDSNAPRTLGSSVWAEKERAFFAEREGEGGSAEGGSSRRGPLAKPSDLARRAADSARAPKPKPPPPPSDSELAAAEAERAAAAEKALRGEDALRAAAERLAALAARHATPLPPADAHLRAEDSDWSDAAFDAASSPIDADAFDTPTLLDLESDGDGFRVAPRTPESEPPTPSPEPSPEHPYALYRDEEGTLRRTASVPAKLDGRARGSEDEDEADAAGGTEKVTEKVTETPKSPPESPPESDADEDVSNASDGPKSDVSSAPSSPSSAPSSPRGAGDDYDARASTLATRVLDAEAAARRVVADRLRVADLSSSRTFVDALGAAGSGSGSDSSGVEDGAEDENRFRDASVDVESEAARTLTRRVLAVSFSFPEARYAPVAGPRAHPKIREIVAKELARRIADAHDAECVEERRADPFDRERIRVVGFSRGALDPKTGEPPTKNVGDGEIGETLAARLHALVAHVEITLTRGDLRGAPDAAPLARLKRRRVARAVASGRRPAEGFGFDPDAPGNAEGSSRVRAERRRTKAAARLEGLRRLRRAVQTAASVGCRGLGATEACVTGVGRPGEIEVPAPPPMLEMFDGDRDAEAEWRARRAGEGEGIEEHERGVGERDAGIGEEERGAPARGEDEEDAVSPPGRASPPRRYADRSGTRASERSEERGVPSGSLRASARSKSLVGALERLVLVADARIGRPTVGAPFGRTPNRAVRTDASEEDDPIRGGARGRAETRRAALLSAANEAEARVGAIGWADRDRDRDREGGGGALARVAAARSGTARGRDDDDDDDDAYVNPRLARLRAREAREADASAPEYQPERPSGEPERPEGGGGGDENADPRGRRSSVFLGGKKVDASRRRVGSPPPASPDAYVNPRLARLRMRDDGPREGTA